jgi:hypothetical protein
MNPVGLLKRPYVFTQQGLLDHEEFAREAAERGVPIEVGQLEALHAAGVLAPLFRLDKWYALEIPDYRRSPGRLRKLLRDGQLVEVTTQPFISWGKFRGRLGGFPAWRSKFLFSPYQLLGLDSVEHLLPQMRQRGQASWGRRYALDARYFLSAGVPVDTVVTLSLLEAAYLPQIRRVLVAPGGNGNWAKDYDAWRHEVDPSQYLADLGTDATTVEKLAEKLIHRAGFIDPLRDWLPLVRQVRPSKRPKLRGPARLAVELREAAEVLLTFYSDLVRVGAADALPNVPEHAAHPLHERLNADRSRLDATLTEYGISPHPALILVLEGDTEMVLVSRALRLLGIRESRNFIELFKAGGVDTDLGPLAYFVSPEVDPTMVLNTEGYHVLARPATRILVSGDEEGGLATKDSRDKKRRRWIGQLREVRPARLARRVHGNGLGRHRDRVRARHLVRGPPRPKTRWAPARLRRYPDLAPDDLRHGGRRLRGPRLPDVALRVWLPEVA